MMQGIRRVLCALMATGALASTLTEQGIANFKDGRYLEAKAKLVEAAKDPRDVEARAFLALTQAALGECEAALPGLISINPAKEELYRLTHLAALKCYSNAGENAKTFALLDELERKFPNDPDVLYLSAKLHMKAFNDATFAMFQRTPASYRVHELSAEIFEVQNRYSDAIGEYRKAIELNPKAPDLHYRLGRAILLESHNPDALNQATEQFQSELKLNPEDGACDFQLGQIAEVQGNRAEAEKYFKKAIDLSPNFTQALIALGKLHTQAKEYPEAIALLSRAVQLQPVNETAHYALLTAYRDSGQMDKAKEEKATLDRLQKPPEGEFSDFLKRLGEKQPEQ